MFSLVFQIYFLNVQNFYDFVVSMMVWLRIVGWSVDLDELELVFFLVFSVYFLNVQNL